MSQIQLLYDLQQCDTEIREKKQRLGEVLRGQKETPEVLAARLEVANMEQELRTAQSRHLDLSLELGGVVDKARRSEQRLYSGDVKNPKELADLQHEIEALGRRRDTLETDVLEALMATEELQANLRAAETVLAQLVESWEQSVETLKKEQQTLAIRLLQVGQLRDQKAGLLTPAMLTTYDRLAKQKGGVAVSRLKGGKCMSCQVTVPADRIRDAEQGRMVYCDSCGRILVAQ